MITLSVEPYCHGCCKFNPVSTTVRILSDSLVYETDKIIKCEHADLCRYLTDRFKQELKEDTNSDGESKQKANSE